MGANECVSIDPLVVIEKALQSPKVYAYLAAQFSVLRTQSGFDPTEVKAAFLAQVSKENIELEGGLVLSRIGNILAMLAPYSVLPGIIENEDVVSLEASRPAAVIE